MAKLGKKYLDKNGLSYLWKKIDGRYVHVETNSDGSYKTGFNADEIIIGINDSNGVKGSGVTIGGATLNETPTVNVVATELAVSKEVEKINSAIDALGSVMSFLGVTETDVEPKKDKDGNITYNESPTIKLTDGTTVTASNGDVVIYNTNTNEPEEFIWTQTGETGKWQEIGKVFNDEAITSVLGEKAIDVATTNGTSTVSLKLNDTTHGSWIRAESGYGHIHLTQDANGLKAEYGREVVTDGDSMIDTDINDAITKASVIEWNDTDKVWKNGFADYKTA